MHVVSDPLAGSGSVTGAAALAATVLLAAKSKMMPMLLGFGLVGLFFISAVDSSFVPLPIPGVTDILVILYGAQHANMALVVALATAGSALGGFVSHAIGQAGGMVFLEKHVSSKLLKRATDWVENHPILSVSLPALLPPPMPLAPFVLIAGAVHMSRRRFMAAFTISRFCRHLIAAWLGIKYGRAVLHLWARFSDRWATTILTVFWSVTVLFTAVGIWKLVQTSRAVRVGEAQPGR